MLVASVGIDKKFQDAILNHQKGDIKEAKKLYEEILEQTSSHVQSLCNLSIIYKLEKEYEKAQKSLELAISLEPTNSIALNNLANLYRERRDFKKAVEIGVKITSLYPKDAHSFNNLAITYEAFGDFDKAFKTYQKAINIDETFTKAYNNIGVLLYKQNRYIQAISVFELALKQDLEDVQTLCNLGASYNKAKRYLDAQKVLEKAITIDINSSGAYVNLGNVYNKLNRHMDALACHNEALKHEPKSASNWANIAITYKHLEQYEKAISSFDKALNIDKNFVNAHFDLATTYLLLGYYEKGFSEYEWRFKKPQMQALLNDHSYIFEKPKFEIDSQSEDKTLLLYSEQGFGDIIQFIRFAEPLKEKYPELKLKVHCRSELKTLLENREFIDEVVSRDEEVGEFDYHLSIMSLPHFLNITLETLPTNVPYLKTDQKALRLYLSKKKLNIGVVWGASNTGESYDDKVFSLEWFKPLMESDNIKLYSLQVGEDAKEIEKLGYGEDMIVDLGESLSDFEITASVVEELDLVISSDTSVAHLCGALGLEVWVLLQKGADWRWGLLDSTTSWYKSARLFRQSTKGDWESVFKDVIEALDTRKK